MHRFLSNHRKKKRPRFVRSVTIAGRLQRQRVKKKGGMGDVKIPVQSGELPVFVTVPEQSAPWPGVVVLHDVAGMSEDLRNQTRWLARAGFLSAAPNLYFRGGMMKCLFAIARDFKARRGQTYEDIEAVRTWLIRQEGCNGKIGVIGFCMGGGFALLLAPDHGFGAASINYGGKLPEDADSFLARACPIVASYGAKDRWTQGVPQQLEQTLTAAGIAHDVKEYPEAGHSFLNNHETSFFKMLQIIHIGYDELAAQDARRRIVSFFQKHLGG
jgi:carboxymethylenebutenolidase